MRRVVMALLVLCLAMPAFAARKRFDTSKLRPGTAADLKIRLAENGRERALSLMKKVRAAEKRDREVRRISAVVDSRATRQIVIPAVGSVRGANNTFFRSDVTFVNWNFDDQDVVFIFLPSGNPGGTRFADGVIAGDAPPITVADIVGTVFQASGLGALIVVPVDAAGDPDDNAAIDVFSRIYTPQPNTTRGTVSQPFPGVDPSHLFNEFEAIILGLRQDPDYRTNVGVVNLSEETLPFSVLILPESGPTGTPFTRLTITLPELSMVQQGLPTTFVGNQGPINLIIGVEEDTDDFAWTAYASSTDNFTGDGWVSMASTILDDEDLDDRSQ